jgi:glycosyltransferase involved in cell wall biosynthesis
MRIGIYIGNGTPVDGGAYSLYETIKKEIAASNLMKHEIIIFFHGRSADRKNIQDGMTYVYLNTGLTFASRLRRKFLYILGKYKSFDQILREKKIDLLWMLGPHNIDVSIPYVFTVWDLGHRMLPCFPEISGNGSEWNNRERLYRKMLCRATYIVTGNETGKQEILGNYALNPGKVKIIPFPVPGFCFENRDIPDAVTSVKSPFVFYPAQFWPHKNHAALIEAVAWIRDTKNIAIYCYFVGSDKGNLKHIRNIIENYHLENQVFILGFVDQMTLLYLYKNALAMTFVSFLGPNNLPPLEALALGCPLVFSNIPGHLEQMEGTGIPVDAANPAGIGEAILSIYGNPDLRKKLVSDGLAFAEKYRRFSYLSEMLKIIDSFSAYRKTWGEAVYD